MPGNNGADLERAGFKLGGEIPDLLRSLFEPAPEPVGLSRKLDFGEARREITSEELPRLFERKLQELSDFAGECLTGDTNRCFTFKAGVRGFVDGKPISALETSGSVTVGEGMDLGRGARVSAPFQQTFEAFLASVEASGLDSIEIELEAEVSAYRDVIRPESDRGELSLDDLFRDFRLFSDHEPAQLPGSKE